MELQLGLALPYNDSDHTSKPKTCLADQQSRAVPRTLPLLSWNNQPNEDQDPPHRLDHDDPYAVHENDESVVGWPPIKSWRRKAMGQQHAAGNYRAAAADNGCRRAGPNSKYVKVKMEGVGIARKIDLSLYDSYQTLMDTLTRRMFHIYRGNYSMDDYKLVYQDGDGDWLLADDVPWRTFVRDARRLKLARTGNGM